MAQIILMHHQCTELSNGKYKKKKPQAKQKQVQHKNVEQRPSNQFKKTFDPRLAHKTKIGAASVDILIILKGSSAQLKNINAWHVTSLATTQAFVSRKPSKNNPTTNTENPLCIN